ncbi:MAG: universal stress protein [Sulfurovum sp.]|nr:universal stress protein [Sulfurovum sp.]
MMKKIEKILVAIDGSVMSQEALKRAVSISKEKNAQLIVVHVIEPSFLESPFLKSIDKDEVKKQITAQVDEIVSAKGLDYLLFVESGSAYGMIHTMTKRLKVDLLVMGVHGKKDPKSSHFGSTALKLVQKTNIPVLIVKNMARKEYSKMIAPTNLSAYSKDSILFAKTLFRNTELKYLYAYVAIDDFQDMTYYVSVDESGQLKKELYTEAHMALNEFVESVAKGGTDLLECEWSVSEELLVHTEKDQADLLVLGSKGVRNLNSFVFGSIASYMIQRSSKDVLAYVPEKLASEHKKEVEEVLTVAKELVDQSSPIQKDLHNREDEIKDDLESFFYDNLKIANWNVPEADNQEIAEGLISILAEKLNEINQKVKDGEYQEKRRDIFQ